jgi:hypothetical protein
MRGPMRPLLIVTGCAAVAALAVALAATPADAAKRKRVVVDNERVVVVPTTRSRPRIVVRGRSFLDAGTEVIPGERKFGVIDVDPQYSALRNADVFGGFRRQPLPDAFDLPGFYRY